MYVVPLIRFDKSLVQIMSLLGIMSHDRNCCSRSNAVSKIMFCLIFNVILSYYQSTSYHNKQHSHPSRCLYRLMKEHNCRYHTEDIAH